MPECPALVRIEIEKWQSVIEIRGRKRIERFIAEVFNHPDRCLFAANIFLDERRAVRIDDIAERVGEFYYRFCQTNAGACAFGWRLHHVWRTELLKYEPRHLSRMHFILQRK